MEWGWREEGLGAEGGVLLGPGSHLVHSPSIPASQPRCPGLSAKASTVEPGGVRPSPARPTPLLPQFLGHRCQPLTLDAPPRLPASATPRVPQPGIQPVACGSPDGSESLHPQNGGGIQAFRNWEEIPSRFPQLRNLSFHTLTTHGGGACLPSPGPGPWKGPCRAGHQKPRAPLAPLPSSPGHPRVTLCSQTCVTWPCPSPSLGLPFPICKMGRTTAQVPVQIKGSNT